MSELYAKAKAARAKLEENYARSIIALADCPPGTPHHEAAKTEALMHALVLHGFDNYIKRHFKEETL